MTGSAKVIARHTEGTTKQNSKVKDPITNINKDSGMSQEKTPEGLPRRSPYALRSSAAAANYKNKNPRESHA